MKSQPQITIQRGMTHADRLRAYKVKVDGAVVATVRRGESATIPITAGWHSVELRVDWCGSEMIQFDIKPGEHVTFECGNNLTGWRAVLWFVYVFFRTRQYLWLRRVT